MRKDQYDVRVSVDGVDLQTFDKLTGGAIDSTETTYQLGGMGPRVTLGGHVTPNNVTVEALYDLGRIHQLIHWLMGRVGKGTMTVVKQPLDPDGNAYGRPITYTGRLKQVIPPEVDSETADAALLGLELTTAGTVT